MHILTFTCPQSITYIHAVTPRIFKLIVCQTVSYTFDRKTRIYVSRKIAMTTHHALVRVTTKPILVKIDNYNAVDQQWLSK